MTAAVFLLALGIATVLLSRWINRRRPRLPPGPRPDPLIGNLRQFASDKSMEVNLTEWSKSYGSSLGAPKSFSVQESNCFTCRRRHPRKGLWTLFSYLELEKGGARSVGEA